MSRTIVGLNDPKAVKKFSALLSVDVGRIAYFHKKFMGVGVDASTPIQLLPQLENDAGDTISYDLSMQLRMQPVEGDNVLEGQEEDLKFYTDSLLIDQMRGGVNTGGKMTRKRTIHDLRAIARKRQSEWWARLFDELIFIYASGARGINTDFIFPTTYTGFANNGLTAPDSLHQMYASTATSPSTITSAMKMDLSLVDRAKTKATMMGGGTTGQPQIQPIKVDGEDHYVFLMNPFQEYDMRTNTATAQWTDIQKALTLSEGAKNPIFRGGLGMYNNVVLHSHKSGIRFSNYGAGANLPAGRALFLGAQAVVVAFGSPGTGLRFDWHEEARDNGNQAVISTSSIFGVKKSSFSIAGSSYDFGVVAADTYAADPG